MEERRVERLEAFSIIALGGYVSDVFERQWNQRVDGEVGVAIPVNDGYKR